jgi:hypothetical protein
MNWAKENTMQNKLQTMLSLQEKLNNDTNGLDWKSGVTKNGKVVNWKRCIYMECAELIDSFSWKHWKNIDGGIDYDNIKIELVDIWHFIMSQLLITGAPESLAVELEKTTDVSVSLKLPKEWRREDNTRIDTLIEPFEELMAMALIKTENELYHELLCEEFFKCCAVADLSFDELYTLYIGKNALNGFRQQNGYKEGTYIKVWNGQEDNVVMQGILSENSDISYDELLRLLENIYQQL